METFLFLVTYITNLDGFYIIKNNRRIQTQQIDLGAEEEANIDINIRGVHC